MKRLHDLSLIVLLCLTLSFQAKARNDTKLPSPFCVIPQPQDVKLLSGHGLTNGALKGVSIVGDFERPIMGEMLDGLAGTHQAGDGILLLKLDSTVKTPSNNEGYVLTIHNNGVEIRSKSEAGLFYGCQTLEQLLEDAKEYHKALPSCEITDYPSLAFRAVHFDVKHHLDHQNYYYESIDRLARYKINAVVFEFEDKLRYQRQPLVGAPQSISIDEMAALTEYARQRHIEIIPLVQGLGHATFILKHQEYAHLRELPWNRWAFCPLHEGTYQVLFDLYRDAIEATPGSKYLHIGGDEIGNIGLCTRCKPMADKQGTMSLNIYWLKRVCEFAKENNRIPIFWDDMPLNFAGVLESTYRDDLSLEKSEKAWSKGASKLDSILKQIPENAVFMRWNYTTPRQPGNIKVLDLYKNRGFHSMIAAASNARGGMFFQEDDRKSENGYSDVKSIRSFIQLAAEKNVPAELCTAWDDNSPHMENYWRGFIASGEYGWSPYGRTLEEYDKAWLQKEFGVSMPDFIQMNNQLYQGSEFWYGVFLKRRTIFTEENRLQGLVQLEHWLKPMEGREKIPFDYTTKLIDLPDFKSPGIWNQKYKDRLDKALIESNNYKNLSEKLNELYTISKRNRYFWKLSIALYDLQSTAPRILLALKEADTADKTQQKIGMENVRISLQKFRLSWDNLQKVYSETRFVSNPANFIPDRFFHYASQSEDLSWMVQAEEMYIGMIEKWMQSQQKN